PDILELCAGKAEGWSLLHWNESAKGVRHVIRIGDTDTSVQRARVKTCLGLASPLGSKVRIAYGIRGKCRLTIVRCDGAPCAHRVKRTRRLARLANGGA